MHVLLLLAPLQISNHVCKGEQEISKTSTGLPTLYDQHIVEGKWKQTKAILTCSINWDGLSKPHTNVSKVILFGTVIMSYTRMGLFCFNVHVISQQTYQ